MKSEWAGTRLLLRLRPLSLCSSHRARAARLPAAAPATRAPSGPRTFALAAPAAGHALPPDASQPGRHSGLCTDVTSSKHLARSLNEMRPPCPHPPPLPHILISVLTVNGQHAVYYAVFILSLAAPGNSDFCLCSSLLYSQRLGQRVLGCLLNE